MERRGPRSWLLRIRVWESDLGQGLRVRGTVPGWVRNIITYHLIHVAGWPSKCRYLGDKPKSILPDSTDHGSFGKEGTKRETLSWWWALGGRIGDWLGAKNLKERRGEFFWPKEQGEKALSMSSKAATELSTHIPGLILDVWLTWTVKDLGSRIYLPILHMRKLRLGEMKRITQVYASSE